MKIKKIVFGRGAYPGYSSSDNYIIASVDWIATIKANGLWEWWNSSDIGYNCLFGAKHYWDDGADEMIPPFLRADHDRYVLNHTTALIRRWEHPATDWTDEKIDRLVERKIRQLCGRYGLEAVFIK